MLFQKVQSDLHPQVQKNPFKKAINSLIQKVTTSDFKNLIKLEKPTKMVKSEPSPQNLQQIQEEKQLNSTQKQRQPRFVRSPQKISTKNKPIVRWNFLSPQARDNPLVHKPPQPKKVEQEKPYRTIVTPPSDLVHDKMKNFEENPEKFLLDVDQGLDKVFKKSVDSIIRTAKVVPVKDWQIRDSTDLLEGFTGEE